MKQRERRVLGGVKRRREEAGEFEMSSWKGFR
jgi:hypothetical protein